MVRANSHPLTLRPRLATFILSELKRGGALIGFEEDCRKAVATSVATGKLQALQSGAPSELEKKKKRAEVKKELEVALGNFVFLDRRINAIVESQWMRERVEGSVVRARGDHAHAHI